MSIKRLLLHEGICQTRAVALDSKGRAVGLHITTDFDKRARLGDMLAGIVTKVSPSDGGCFVKLESNEEAFLSLQSAGQIAEGQRHVFYIAAEARRNKRPRVVIVKSQDHDIPAGAPIECWQSALPAGQEISFETGPNITHEIDGVFEDAQSPICALERGGRLQVTPTPALVAIDVDTIGRQDKGRASARARAVNLDAAETAGRQMALRNLGGNIVIDCVGPLARAHGSDIKAAFVGAFRAASLRKVSCLPPSPLGMMEASIAHGARPLQDLQGAMLLDGLRAVEIEAVARPADRLELSVPKSAYGLYLSHRKTVDLALKARFGARIIVTESNSLQYGVTNR